MKLMLSLFVLICVWINAKGETSNYGESPFLLYQKCINGNKVAAWKLLGMNFNGTYYNNFNYQFNNIFGKVYPIAIFTPTSVKDVQSAVTCGVKTNIQLVPIAGGHSYAGLSIGTNDSIIVDMRYLREISINRKEMVATVGSGTFLGNVYGTLWKNGGFGASLGSCTTVAMAGLAIGGGIGYFSARYGLVIDNLLEINMVDVRGNAVFVDKTHNTDLWWAMRGIGPGYIGLVTSVKLKLFKADELKLTYVKFKFDNNRFAGVMNDFTAWLDWVKNNDPTVNSVMLIRSDNYTISDKKSGRPDETGITLQILKIEDPEVGAMLNLDFLNAALNIFTKPNSVIIKFPSFIDFFHEVSYTPVREDEEYNEKSNEKKLEFLSKITRESGAPAYHLAKSFYIKKEYKAGSFEEAQKVLLEIPNSYCGVHVNYEQGAVGQIPANDSSYVHRDALFSFKVYFETESLEKVAESENWMNKLYQAVKFLDSGKTYQNYPERGIKNYLDRYYGSNLKRLIEIKRKWDPKGYFNSEQSIPIN